MVKSTKAKQIQNKANFRSLIKGSLHMAVCFLNKDFRDEVVDYVIESAKENSVKDIKDLSSIDLYPKFTLVRRSILNALDTVELNMVVNIDHLTNDYLKKHMQKSIDLALDASGWTLEEFNSIKNYNHSAMSLTNKIAHVLANPKDNCLINEGIGILMEFAAPFMETHQRMSEGLAEVVETSIKASLEIPEHPDYKLQYGDIIPTESLKDYERYSTHEYLTESLGFNDDNANALKIEDGLKYDLPSEIFTVMQEYRAGQWTNDEYNSKVAEILESIKTSNS